MKMLHKIYGSIMLLIYFVVFFPIMLISLLFPLRWRLLSVIKVFWKGFSFMLLSVITRATIKVIDKRSNECREQTPLFPVLYIANHSSFMDIPLILYYMQIPPIMKKEILKMPFIGIYGLASGAIPVDRKNAASRKLALTSMCQRMSAGVCVQYYPEGTRSRLGHPKAYKDIKTSLMRYAYENDIPVCPITMANTEKILDKKLNITTKIKLGIYFDQEVYPKDFETSDEFCSFSWSKVEDNYSYFQTILGQ